MGGCITGGEEMKKMILLIMAVLFLGACTSTGTTEDTTERMSRGNENFYRSESPFDNFERDYSERRD